MRILTVEDSEYIKSNTSFIDVDTHHLRIFYAPHSLVSKLPRPTPLIVFIHGLGAQINQFEPLLKYFGQVADVLSLDLPGCGQSPLLDKRWDQYTTDALANLIHKVIDIKAPGHKVILMGHSLGTMIAGNLALKLGERCLAMVLLSPKAEISEKEVRGIHILSSLPEFIFNIFRKLDRAYCPLGVG
jgi:pimeloyl-ACP methyl ester carboxylesterase